MTDIAANLAAVEARIAAACERAGRDRSAVTLVAVSKRHPAPAIVEAYGAGQIDFGENYAQELRHKISEIADPAREGSIDIRWHFIGHLQRNKVKDVVGDVALIHTVDSERLLRAIDRRAGDRGLVQPVLVEVNLGGEDTKSGVDRDGAGRLVELAGDLEHVECRGLMTMPPLPETPEDSRGHFVELRRLAEALGVAELSMGTTGDLEVAVEEGATLIRVGTAVFGPRS